MSEHRWNPLAPDDVSMLFAPLGVPYWVAGGLAIDLHLGKTTRAHGDIDIAILRGDETALATLLTDWEIAIAHDGSFEAWDGAALDESRHQFWVRRRGAEEWSFEVLLEQHYGDSWLFRRSATVTLPLSHIGRRTAGGVPYLAPEICLLYKAKWSDVDRNALDFANTSGTLDAAARAWLGKALQDVHPGHPWLDKLIPAN